MENVLAVGGFGLVDRSFIALPPRLNGEKKSHKHIHKFLVVVGEFKKKKPAVVTLETLSRVSLENIFMAKSPLSQHTFITILHFSKLKVICHRAGMHHAFSNHVKLGLPKVMQQQ